MLIALKPATFLTMVQDLVEGSENFVVSFYFVL